MIVFKKFGLSPEELADWKKFGISLDKRTMKNLIKAYESNYVVTYDDILNFEKNWIFFTR